MSKIDDLIQQHCPNGVEFREIQEIFDMKNGYTPSTANKIYWTNGTIPWFRMEDIRENGRILNASLQMITKDAVKGGRLFPANSIIMATSATIGEHALITIPHLSNQRFTSLSLKPKYATRLNIYFVFYYCFTLSNWCKNNITKSSFASVDMAGFKKFYFPIPPLPVQEEIVRILDKFTALEAELEAELEARRAQYEYYRDKLLIFSELEKQGGGVTLMSLGEIGTFVRGNGLQKKDFVASGVGCIHYGQIYTHYGTFTDKTKSFVSPELAKRLKKAHKGDLVIASTSENVEDVCKAVAWLGDEEVAVSGDAYIFRHNQNPKFMAYYLQTPAFFDFKKKCATGTKVIRVSGDSMAKFQVMLPSLVEQERIVTILDKFDALVNDISIGLPAEIRARKQQYEYYRERLLSFQSA